MDICVFVAVLFCQAIRCNNIPAKSVSGTIIYFLPVKAGYEKSAS